MNSPAMAPPSPPKYPCADSENGGQHPGNVRVTESFCADLVSRAGGPTVSALSSGLDSTFMVSSLARATTSAILSFTHTPLPEVVAMHTQPAAVDESWATEIMASAYQGRGIRGEFCTVENAQIAQGTHVI